MTQDFPTRFRSALASLAGLGLFVATIPVALTANAGGTRTHDVESFSDLDDGEVDGAAVEGTGRVTRGFDTSRADISGSSVAFTCLAAGKKAFVGTADKATIQTVELTGGKKAEPKVKQLAELPGVVVTSMVSLKNGDVLAATLPGGDIHRIDKKGKVEPFATLSVDSIWDMEVHKGRLLVATGGKGELHSLSLDGKDDNVVLDVSERHLLSVAATGDTIFAGSSPSAKLYQVSDDVEGILAHDFSGTELHNIAFTDRGLVAAVNDFSDRGINTLKNLTTQLNRTSLTAPPPSSPTSSDDEPKASAEVWYVDLGPKMDTARASEAAWEKWLDKDRQYFTGLTTVDKGKSVLVSSSRAGKIYRLRGRRDVSTIADLEERQATSICALSDQRVLATTGDGAAVYGLQSVPAAKSLYFSDILDAKQPADYGALELRGIGKLTVRARSGPSEDPDEKRWSAWKPVKLTQDGASRRGTIAVPHRRYLQLEVSLDDADSELQDFKIFYTPENLAPLIKQVAVSGPSFDEDDDDEPDAEAKIAWKAEARDEDDLIYEVRLRERGDKGWTRLDEDGTTKEELSLDLTTVPDGVYEVGVVASDEPSNGTDRAATDELISAPFVVDRTRPKIDSVKAGNNRSVTGVARDDAGRIHDVAFAIDGREFRPASASDGIYDQATESFELTLPDDLRPGRHRLVIRARDNHGNIASAALAVEI